MSEQKEDKMKKQAFFTFVPLAAVVYLIAIGYSLSTDHTFAATLLCVAGIGASILATWVYRSN